MNRPTLHILVGVPGSGKSTFAHTYLPNCIYLSSDKIREELWGDESVQGNPSQVFSLMQSRAIEALSDGKDVVYDATNITRKNRASIISVTPKFAKIVAHVVYAPIDVCKHRDANRSRSVGSDVIDKMLKQFQFPFYDEGIEEIDIFDTTKHQAEMQDAYLSILKRRIESIEDNMKIPHDNPHHEYCIYKHSQTASNYAKDKDWDNNMILAAFYHDCGKPYVKSFTDTKGNITDIAHYYQHQNVGAWIACGIIDTPEIIWLINNHMGPFNNEKYYNNLPTYLKNRIDMIHECDINAH